MNTRGIYKIKHNKDELLWMYFLKKHKIIETAENQQTHNTSIYFTKV